MPSKIHAKLQAALPERGAPRVLVVNELLRMFGHGVVIVLQIRLSRSAEDLKGAWVALLKSGYVYGLAMGVLLAFTVHQVVVGLIALVLFVVLLTLGEIFLAAGAWGLSYGLAPEESHGSYQALFALVSPIGTVLGPFLVGTLLIPHPRVGLAVFAAVFAGTALILQTSSRFADRASLATESLAAEGAV